MNIPNEEIQLSEFDKIEFENVFCPLCGPEGDQKKIISDAPDRYNKLPGRFSAVQCESCGLVFQNPRPKEEYIFLYYPDRTGYFNPVEPNEHHVKKWLTKQILKNYYGYSHFGKNNSFLKTILFPVYFIFFRPQSIPYYVANGKLLEIGCSNGAKLKRLQQIGWKVVGVEPNMKAADGARKRGLEIRSGSIFDVDFPKESFDVILMDMVLEHLYDPLKALSLINRWLKKGGQLIFTIPSFDGIEFSIYKEYAYPLQLPNHTYFFGKKNINRLLSKNFKNIKLLYQHVDRDFVASAYYRYSEKGKLIDKILSKNKFVRFFLIKPASLIFSLCKKTSRITVFSEKK